MATIDIRNVLLTAIVIFGFMASASNAATFLFDETRGDAGTTTMHFTAGDLELDVTSSGGNLNHRAAGFGVSGPPLTPGRMSGPETLTFEFSRTVNLISSVIFERTGGEDEITITDLLGTVLAVFTVGDGTDANSFESVALNLVGDAFVFTRTGGFGSRPGVRISSLTATAVIPAPAALPLMIGGLGLFAFIARRRQMARRL